MDSEQYITVGEPVRFTRRCKLSLHWPEYGLALVIFALPIYALFLLVNMESWVGEDLADALFIPMALLLSALSMIYPLVLILPSFFILPWLQRWAKTESWSREIRQAFTGRGIHCFAVGLSLNPRAAGGGSRPSSKRPTMWASFRSGRTISSSTATRLSCVSRGAVFDPPPLAEHGIRPA